MNIRKAFKAAALGCAGLLVVGCSHQASSPEPSPQIAPHAARAFQANEGFKHPTLASASTESVGAALVCFMDVSGSIDYAEYEVQIEAVAAAIESEDFRNAIFYIGGPQSLAIFIGEFGSDATPRIGWVDIREGEEWKLKALADEIRDLYRADTGSTNHSAALKDASTYFAALPWEADRKIVNILTDGKHNMGYPTPDVLVESLAVNEEATVNAFLTLDYGEYELDKWAKDNLVTKPIYTKKDGTFLDPGFVKIVATQQSITSPGTTVKFRKAMELAFRRTLILEVAGLDNTPELPYVMKIKPETPEAPR